MGSISKFFGEKSKIPITSKMMGEDQFWNLIEKSLKNTIGQSAQEAYLIKDLQNLSPEELIGFRLRTDKLLFDTYNSEMWCAAYIMNGGCSDDCFEYFRLWIISRGKDVFQKAEANPDSLIAEIVEGQEYYDFESFWYIALVAFENKTAKELYDYIDYDNHKFREGNYPNFDFNWEEEKPESMSVICPKLYAKLWK